MTADAPTAAVSLVTHSSLITHHMVPRHHYRRVLLGWALAVACLAWVFHGVHPARFWSQIKGVDPRWAGLGIVCDVATFISQGWRWKVLLRPLGRLSLLRATEAVYVGLFSSEMLPLRAGEFVRAYLVARWLRSNVAAVVPSMVAERLFDGLWLAAGFALVAMFVPLPGGLARAGDIVGGAVLLLAAAFVWAVVRARRSPAALSNRAPAGMRLGIVRRLITEAAHGLRTIGAGRNLLLAAAISLLMLTLQVLAFWLIMRAAGLNRSFWIAAAVLLIVRIGTAVPNTPANIGTFQFFCVVGLTLFGVEKTQATAFSVIVFAVLTLPLWSLGSLALARTGFSLRRLRLESTESEESADYTDS